MLMEGNGSSLGFNIPVFQIGPAIYTPTGMLSNGRGAQVFEVDDGQVRLRV